ncbi:MAG TPA: TIGR04282 family arsenosugar biosynthesis glycosyltransferase [Acetobacteraceae bacterium]|nr:TIGR04282 family arsenosugar biosynthesis glycosyltransferase [Acetobacteraceae bacterium]
MTRDIAVVFARVPRLGTVKRRLAKQIGDRAALRFHAQTLMHLLRMLSADRRFQTLLCATPDRATLRLPPRIRRISQGSGDLGQRMARVFQRFPHRRVAIIGCDIPQANADDLAAAFRALGRADAAFGPAVDGGYWLVALSPRRPSRPFARVRWSTPQARADTLANFAHRRVALLRTLHDVDTAEDLPGLQSPCSRRPCPERQIHRLQPGRHNETTSAQPP